MLKVKNEMKHFLACNFGLINRFLWNDFYFLIIRKVALINLKYYHRDLLSNALDGS
jgi:hypothetical protein